MTVDFRESFDKDLSKLRDKSLVPKILQIIENVENASSVQEIRNLKKMTGFKNVFRIRVGDYRIGIKLEDGVMVFYRFLHRREMYRFFPCNHSPTPKGQGPKKAARHG